MGTTPKTMTDSIAMIGKTITGDELSALLASIPEGRKCYFERVSAGWKIHAMQESPVEVRKKVDAVAVGEAWATRYFGDAADVKACKIALNEKMNSDERLMDQMLDWCNRIMSEGIAFDLKRLSPHQKEAFIAAVRYLLGSDKAGLLKVI